MPNTERFNCEVTGQCDNTWNSDFAPTEPLDNKKDLKPIEPTGDEVDIDMAFIPVRNGHTLEIEYALYLREARKLKKVTLWILEYPTYCELCGKDIVKNNPVLYCQKVSNNLGGLVHKNCYIKYKQKKEKRYQEIQKKIDLSRAYWIPAVRPLSPSEYQWELYQTSPPYTTTSYQTTYSTSTTGNAGMYISETTCTSGGYVTLGSSATTNYYSEGGR
jgi:hypothetical protein